MKKTIITLGIIIFGTIAVAIFSINGIIKSGVESVAPTITKTDVTLDSVNISIFSGSGSLSGLVVGSPKGFKSDHVFSLGEIGVNIDIGSLMSDTILIKEIIIDSPDVVYELGKSGLNINTIVNNAKSASSQQSVNEASGETSYSSGSKKVVIENFKIKNGKVTMAASLFGGGAPGASIPMPDIHLKDIGKDSGGTSFESALAKILGAVSKKVATLSVNSDQLKGAAEDVKGTLGGAADKLKGFFN